MPTTARLIYVSTARPGLIFADIEAILDAARSRNAAEDITGLLLFDGSSFMQLLEGPEDAIERVFSSIADDDRHTGIVRIHSETDVEREFSDWAMGYSLLDDPRAPSGSAWFPLTNSLLVKHLPAGMTPWIRNLFLSFLSVARAAE